MKETPNREKLSLKLRLGYGIGQMSDSLPYNFIATYALFFLTNVAGIPVAIGGTIAMIAILWDAVTDPVIGHLSDTSKSKYGRRRPFMIVSLLPMCIFAVLYFTAVDFGTVGTCVYYILIAMLYRTFYTGYVIPYFSLGAEITQDYDERVTIQCISAYFVYFAVWLCTAGPMKVIEIALEKGISYSTSWCLAALSVAVCTLICGVISWRSLRGKEMVDKRDDILNEEGERNIKSVIQTYWTLLKDKICIKIILFRITFIFSAGLASAAFVYLMSVNLGLSESQQALYWTLYSVIYIIDIAICNFISDKTDKRFLMGAAILFGILVGIFFYFFNINSFAQLVLYTFLHSFSAAAFWSVGATMMYDYNEIVEFKTGKRQEGAVSGLILFAQKIGSAISVGTSGMVLSLVGYDGTAEFHSEAVKHGILFLNTLGPAIISVLTLLCIIFYPITRKNFDLLRNALELKREGKAYSTEGFEKLL